jgi:drug/metabolite transporter (DMT)-like permease
VLRPGDALRAGDLWTLGCALAFALHIVWVGRFARQHPTLRLTWVQIVVAALALGSGTFVFEPDALEVSSELVAGRELILGVSPLFIGAAAFTGVFATAVAFLLQVKMQRETTATHTAIIFSAEPVFAALVSLVVRHELPAIEEAAGGALILGGIVLVQLAVAKRKEG